MNAKATNGSDDAGSHDNVPQFTGSNVPDDVKKDFYKKALRAKQEAEKAAEIYKAANADYRLVLKAAKKAGVSSEAIAYALAARLIDKDELIALEREKARMLALSGVWPSIQEDFFDRLTPGVDLTNETTIEVSYDNGHTCGIKGENRSLNPHHTGTEKWDAWDRGWLQGQGTNVEKLSKAPRPKKQTKHEAAAALAAAEAAPPGEVSADDEPLFTE
jgi:ribosome modulation factor